VKFPEPATDTQEGVVLRRKTLVNRPAPGTEGTPKGLRLLDLDPGASVALGHI